MLYNHLSYTAKKKVEPQDSNDVNDALATAMEYAAATPSLAATITSWMATPMW